MLGQVKETARHPFTVNLMYTVTVTGKLRTLELYSQNYCRFSIMEKEKGLEGLNRVLDERK